MINKAATEIDTLVRARYPLIVIETHEEERAMAMVRAIADDRNKKTLCWSVTRGIYEHHRSATAKQGVDKGSRDPLAALDRIMEMVEPAIYVALDFHPFVGEPSVVRKLRELAQHLKNSYKSVIFISHRFPIPEELDKEITVVSLPLPTLDELRQLLDDTIAEVNENTTIHIESGGVAREPVLKAAQGLTLNEAENVFAKTLVSGGRLTHEDIPVILGEKEQIIRKSGILEYTPPTEEFRQIGGLDVLKTWLTKRRLGFNEEARAFGLPYPSGVLLLGVQGCGKSLCAKAVAGHWQLPLLRFDVGKVFSSLVGSSEENIRKAIAVAESVAPAILWVDEIEKAFAGMQGSGASDGGTSSRVFGTFLTWLQEKQSPVFVIATANDISSLPPEMLRKGRLDEVFFVDLPTPAEREEIVRIHVTKRGREVAEMDLPVLAASSDGFSGAEIEQGIISALFDCYEGQLELDTEAIKRAFTETVPLSTTMKEGIQELRTWASGRARLATSTESSTGDHASGRRFEL